MACAGLGAEHDLNKRVLIAVERVRATGHKLLQASAAAAGGSQRGGWLGRGPRRLGSQQVVVLLERRGQLAHRVLAHAQQQRSLDNAAQRLLEGVTPEPRLEALVEEQLLLDLVEGGEARRQAGLEGQRA